MSEERATQQSVTLYPADRAIVEKAMNAVRTANFSAGLQFIIRDWAALKAELEGAQITKHQTVKA
jgi:hypothetical protein